MNWGYALVVATTFSILFILSQRIVRGYKRGFRMFIAFLAIFLFLMQADLIRETLFAYAIALLLSFLFWLLIGRYNPVGEEDTIKVYGMDD